MRVLIVVHVRDKRKIWMVKKTQKEFLEKLEENDINYKRLMDPRKLKRQNRGTKMKPGGENFERNQTNYIGNVLLIEYNLGRWV